jgi:cobalt-zinc-cadmium efflux system membrane fusion protein
MKPTTSPELRADASHPPVAANAPPPIAAAVRPKRWVLMAALAAAAAVGAGLYLGRDHLFHGATHAADEHPREAKQAKGAWDGYVSMPHEAQTALGLTTAKVKAQSKPLPLPLLGTTKHDETKITKIRPYFRGRVDKIYVDVGQTVEKGTPIVDLYSADLARAKTDFSIERSQWQFQKRLLEQRNDLAKTGAISKNLLLETESNEMRERREYEIAREKLQLFGLRDEEIDHLDQEQGPEQARLTVRSPAGGVIIRRDVVSGNIYDEGDVLVAIAPGDHLWVVGEVFESDLSLVHLGQIWNVEFPFLEKTVQGKVEFISENVDPAVHAVRIRTSIPNPDGHLKADMLVRGTLEIPPEHDNTCVPRSAVVVVDGHTYAFVRSSHNPTKFERRGLVTVHEHNDKVIVKSGVQEGEEIVVTGGLMLQQLYEDSANVAGPTETDSDPAA